MPESPASKNAQKVLMLLQNNVLPNSELVRLITLYGGGDPVLSYWEGFIPNRGEEMLKFTRCCYRVNGDSSHDVVGAPAYQYVRHLIASGFVWTDPHSFQIGEPIFYEISGASTCLERGRCERLDHLLNRLLPEVDSTVALLRKFDPWQPAIPLSKEQQVPWFAVPRDLGDADRTFIFESQREVIATLLRWIASYAKAGKDERVTELTHLIDLIVEYRNFLWGFRLLDDPKKPNEFRPIIFVQRTSALASSGLRPPSTVYSE